MDLFNERSVTWLDGCYLGGLALICAVLTLNIFLHSLLLIYLVILSGLAFLVYASRREGAPPPLRGEWIMGLLSLLPYPFVDHFFEARPRLVTFSLMPLYLHHRHVAGLLLYAFTGASWWIFYRLISWLASTCGGWEPIREGHERLPG